MSAKPSEEVRQARNRYQREYYHRRMKTAEGRKQFAAIQERYWLKKAEEYRRLDEAKATNAGRIYE